MNSFEKWLGERNNHDDPRALATEYWMRKAYLAGLRHAAEMIRNAEYDRPTPLAMVEMIKSEASLIEGKK